MAPGRDPRIKLPTKLAWSVWAAAALAREANGAKRREINPVIGRSDATPKTPLSQTPRTTLRRHRERGATDRAELYAVLDAGLICHLGVVADGGPVVLPTAYGREGEPCGRCGAPIRRDTFMNRSAYSCPRCQPRPRNAHW